MPKKNNLPDYEHRLNQAIDFARKHPNEPKAPIARQYGVDPETLRRRLNGTQKVRQEAHVYRQHLTPSQEIAVGEWAGHMNTLGFPVSHSMLRTMACKIAGIENIGKEWVSRFLERNEELRVRVAHYTENRRKEAADGDGILSFYRRLRNVIRRNAIRAENIWNCDEKGFRMGEEMEKKR